MRSIIILLIILIPYLLSAQTFTDNGAKSYTLDQIGIGISDPGSYRLYVNGSTFNKGTQYFQTVAHDGENSLTHLAFPASTDGFYLITRQLQPDKMEVIFRMRDNITGDYFKIWFDDYRGESYDRYPFMVAGDRVLLVNDGGAVGIGTSDIGGYKLSVAGKVRAEEVKVEAAPWPDYVFEEDYDLKSLEETEKYIQENKHLPNMPSAQEVAENGVSLGEMNAKLLLKIEELTLHSIYQEKKITEQNKKIEVLIKRLSELESIVNNY